MGNKLGQPGAEDYEHYAQKKKDHVLRLWADIFNVHDETKPETELNWHKISESVVPVNVSRISDESQTIYQVSAYNSNVEKICDVNIVQPGTKLRQPTESFIHMKDVITNKHWGFNFTSTDDAAKFRDTCLTLSTSPVHTTHNTGKGFGSLRVGSSTKKWRGSDKGSAKRSRTHESLSPAKVNSRLTSSHSADNEIAVIATMPRQRHQPVRMDSRLIFAHQLHTPPVQASSPQTQATQPEHSAPTSFSDSLPSPLTSNLPEPPTEPRQEAEGAESKSAWALSPKRFQNDVNDVRNSSSSSTGDEQYDKPSTLSSSHLHAILFSSENLVADIEKGRTNFNQLTALSEEAESSGLDEEPLIISGPRLADPDTPTTKARSRLADKNTDDQLNLETRTLQKMLNNNPSPDLPPDPVFGKDADSGDPRITGPLSASPAVKPENQASTSPLTKQSLNSYRESGSDHVKSKAYPDSGFGGTNSTEKTESVGSISQRSQKSKMSASARSRSSCKSLSNSDSLSDQSSSHPSGSQVTHVLPFTLISDDDGSASETGSIETVPPPNGLGDTSYLRLSGRQGGSATKRTGWLEVKNWLVHVKTRVGLAARRSWRRYWVTLRGHSLLLYAVNDQTSMSEDMVPRHVITVDDCMVQSIPEHTKRENIFAMSTAFGDAYLFQAPTQIEHDNWISSIMSTCASYHCKQQALSANPAQQLQTDIQQLQHTIDEDSKMKKMAELQLSVTKDSKSREAMTKQISQWEDNLERVFMDQYRYKCYLATLQGQELPNPKSVLGQISRSGKRRLGKLGVLNVTSFHCLVCARTPNAYNTYLNSRSKGNGLRTARRSSRTKVIQEETTYPLPSTGSDEADHMSEHSDENENPVEGSQYSNAKSSSEHKSSSGKEGSQLNQSSSNHGSLLGQSANHSVVSLSQQRSKFGENLVRVQLSQEQSIVVEVEDDWMISDLLKAVCNKRQLVASDSFVRYLETQESDPVVPHSDEYLDKLMQHLKNFDQEFVRIEVCPKCIFQVELLPTSRSEVGLKVEAELDDDGETEDDQKIFIFFVKEGSLAEGAGLMVGDELLTINSKMVSSMDIEGVEEMLASEDAIYITIRSCRIESPQVTSPLTSHADAYIDNMMCPPPPSQQRISDRIIDNLIVPAPSWVHDSGNVQQVSADEELENSQSNTSDVNELLHGAEKVTAICRMASINADDNNGTANPAPAVIPTPLSEGQKLRKVILELINTEKSYVRDLQILMDRYLEPLKDETFLSSDELVRLVGNIQEIVHFQREFLKNLEETIEEPLFLTFSHTLQFKNILFAIAGSFLFYANHFKLYSSFCASHSRAQKVLRPGEHNSDLYEFLRARNPKQQHSATLESYLIKPIQRILKYPLLITELRSLTEKGSDEQAHLTEALKAMESVAEHINEMQKLYEEFGDVFDQVAAAAKDNPGDRKKLELNVGELMHYGEADWLNAVDDIGKPRKSFEFVSTVFVFKHGVLFLSQQKLRGKPKKYKGGTARGSIIYEGPETVYYRFIPVTDLQVRTLPTAHARQPVALWEILHLKSAADQRPEKTYHMACSTVDERSAFMKHMRQLIRDSVRKMTVPRLRIVAATDVKLRHSAVVDADTRLNVLALPDRHDRPVSFENRYSMNVDLSSPIEPPEFQTQRSRTVADLADLLNPDDDLSQNTSKPSVDSAKLIYSSHDPVNYSSRGSLDNSPGSDIWEKREDNSSQIVCDEFLYPGSIAVKSHLESHYTKVVKERSAATEC